MIRDKTFFEDTRTLFREKIRFQGNVESGQRGNGCMAAFY